MFCIYQQILVLGQRYGSCVPFCDLRSQDGPVVSYDGLDTRLVMHKQQHWLQYGRMAGGRAGRCAGAAQVPVTHGTARPSSACLQLQGSKLQQNRQPPPSRPCPLPVPAKLPFRPRPHTPQPTAWFLCLGTATTPQSSAWGHRTGAYRQVTCKAVTDE